MPEELQIIIVAQGGTQDKTSRADVKQAGQGPAGSPIGHLVQPKSTKGAASVVAAGGIADQVKISQIVRTNVSSEVTKALHKSVTNVKGPTKLPLNFGIVGNPLSSVASEAVQTSAFVGQGAARIPGSTAKALLSLEDLLATRKRTAVTPHIADIRKQTFAEMASDPQDRRTTFTNRKGVRIFRDKLFESSPRKLGIAMKSSLITQAALKVTDSDATKSVNTVAKRIRQYGRGGLSKVSEAIGTLAGLRGLTRFATLGPMSTVGVFFVAAGLATTEAAEVMEESRDDERDLIKNLQTTSAAARRKQVEAIAQKREEAIQKKTFGELLMIGSSTGAVLGLAGGPIGVLIGTLAGSIGAAIASVSGVGGAAKREARTKLHLKFATAQDLEDNIYTDIQINPEDKEHLSRVRAFFSDNQNLKGLVRRVPLPAGIGIGDVNIHRKIAAKEFAEGYSQIMKKIALDHQGRKNATHREIP